MTDPNEFTIPGKHGPGEDGDSRDDPRWQIRHAREVDPVEECHPVERDKPMVKVNGIWDDSNAFAILGKCRNAAKRAGWTDDQFKAVRTEATSGDYDHLLATVADYFEEDCDDDDES